MNALIENEIPALKAELQKAGAPWSVGDPIGL